MDKITRVFLLLTAACLTTGQDTGPFTVEIEGESKYEVATGTSLVFKCIINSGLAVTLKYAPEWWHQSLVDPDKSKEVQLTNMEALQDAASPDDFAIKVEYDSDHLFLTLTVKAVKVEHDGKFICRLSPLSGGKDLVHNDVEVVVVNDVQDMALTFDGEAPVTGEEGTAVEREEGEYGVTCMATGFSPSASIKIYVGDEELPTGGADSTFDADASKAAGARRYQATATVGAVTLRADHSEKRLRCEAQASYDGAAKLVASVPLCVIALEPLITCDKNASAHPGDLYVKIACEVDHSNVKVVAYSFEIGDTGDIIFPGNVSKSYDEVTLKEIDEHTTVVTLDLYQAKEMYFDTVYYLDVRTESGQTFRQKATLIRLDPTGAASAMSVSKAAVLCLSFLLSLLLSL